MSDIIYYNTLAFVIFSIPRWTLYWFFGWKIEAWILHALRWVIMVILRLVMGSWAKTRKRYKAYKAQQNAVPKPTFPAKVWQIPAWTRMKPAEVVVCFAGRRPIKCDFDQDHTLIGATPGRGKTNLINSILIQLFAKGVYFTSKYDVVLIDLKGDDKRDFLNLWKPLLYRYYSIDQGAMGGAIEAIKFILAEAQRRKREGGKKMLVFIDEFAMLTIKAGQDRKTGEDILWELANLGRTVLTLIGATQMPHHSVIPTTIRHALTRRICGGVADESHAKVILGRDIAKNDIPVHRGEVIVIDPAHISMFNSWQKGKVMLVNVPDDIEHVVNQAVEAMVPSGDKRIDLFRIVAKGKQVGESIIGIGNFEHPDYGPNFVKEAYPRYRHVGIFAHNGKNGAPHTLAMPYAEAVMQLNKYIEEGKWTENQKAVKK